MNCHISLLIPFTYVAFLGFFRILSLGCLFERSDMFSLRSPSLFSSEDQSST